MITEIILSEAEKVKMIFRSGKEGSFDHRPDVIDIQVAINEKVYNTVKFRKESLPDILEALVIHARELGIRDRDWYFEG